MNPHLVSALILLLALGLYALGVSQAAGLFLVFGFVLEIWFWVRVSAKPNHHGK